ncbi:DNA (cytosine-5)-methyltransferase 1 [Roseovarius nanhaiticus]|uniref:Cytosine-specific methyltransferase n=1 Tax=Roseovarius nanhaiticus TaxID=573024 RepID=A0A1N7FL50_9RHOB|nr:DNA (cytosine-5)-methyltransferase 1 [Roseovarius nanhaiticus]
MSKFGKSKHTVVSLFSGCGGLDHGFQETGFDILGAFDSNSAAMDCYRSNNKTPTKIALISEQFEIPGNVDVILAGPPCQGFSTGGGYKENDERNDLLLVTCRLIAKYRPKLAVIENVAALTNKKNVSYFRAALSILSEAGYYCTAKVYSADEFGVPQRRKRTVIVARSNGALITDLSPQSLGRATVRTALEGINFDAQAHSPTYPEQGGKHDIIAKKIKPGQKLCNVRASAASVATWEIPEWFGAVSAAERVTLETIRTLRRRNRKRSFGDADPVSLDEINQQNSSITSECLSSLQKKGYLRKVGDLYDLRDTFNGKYRRLSLDDVSPTVDTRFGDVQLFLHPLENRGLTIREAARLQGFPDEYSFPERMKDAFRMIGNAVPPPMSRQIAEYCREILA